MSDNFSPKQTIKNAALSRRHLIQGTGASAIGIALAGLRSSATAVPRTQAPRRPKHFIRESKESHLFDLSPVWDENPPHASANPPNSMGLNKYHALDANHSAQR